MKDERIREKCSVIRENHHFQWISDYFLFVSLKNRYFSLFRSKLILVEIQP